MITFPVVHTAIRRTSIFAAIVAQSYVIMARKVSPVPYVVMSVKCNMLKVLI